jgi:hypothetical protein
MSELKVESIGIHPLFYANKKVWVQKHPHLRKQFKIQSFYRKPANCFKRQSGEKRVLLLFRKQVFNYQELLYHKC